jgi:hypothetical protein
MQGFYVQLSRSKQRTDLYLTVGPAPIDLEEAHAHPRGEPVEPEQLLGRIMARDGSKTLASDLPSVVDVRRWSTRQLRAERDRIQAARAECPADRARELALATRRAAELEQARRQALADLEAARAEAAGARGRAGRLAARDRLALAEHRVGALARQADQAAERVGMLRRHQQQRAGWLEAHDAELGRERLVARELGWRRHVDERAMALDPPGWLVAELGPVPEQPAERQAWLVAAAELDAYRRVHGLPEPPERAQRRGGPSEGDRDTTRIERTRDDHQDERMRAPRAAAGRDSDRDRPRPQHGAAVRAPAGGSVVDARRITQDGQDEHAEPSRPAAKEPAGPAHPAPGRVSRPAPERPGWHRRQHDADDTAQDRPAGPDREHGDRVRPAPAGRLDAVLGRQPGRDRPGQRRDWHAVRAALERLAEQRERLRRGDRQDRAGHPDRDRRHRQDRDRHERDGR